MRGRGIRGAGWGAWGAGKSAGLLRGDFVEEVTSRELPGARAATACEKSLSRLCPPPPPQPDGGGPRERGLDWGPGSVGAHGWLDGQPAGLTLVGGRCCSTAESGRLRSGGLPWGPTGAGWPGPWGARLLWARSPQRHHRATRSNSDVDPLLPSRRRTDPSRTQEAATALGGGASGQRACTSGGTQVGKVGLQACLLLPLDLWTCRDRWFHPFLNTFISE